MTPTDLLLVRGVLGEKLASMSTHDIDTSLEVTVPLQRAVSNLARERELPLVLLSAFGDAPSEDEPPPPPPPNRPGRDISVLGPVVPYHAQRALPIQMHSGGRPPGLGVGQGGSERPHQWGETSQFPDAGSNHHGKRCLSCGVVTFYGTRYGSNKHPGFSYVDPICPGRRYPLW